MGAQFKGLKVGRLYRVEWLDATGYIGVDIGEVKPWPCKTIGWLQAVSKNHITLATSLYDDESGDFTCIPASMLLDAKEIKE